MQVMRGLWTIVTYIVLGYCEVQTCIHYGISIEMGMQLEKEREIVNCSMCVRKYKACAKI